MDTIRDYVLTVIIVSLICSILSGLVNTSAMRTLIRLVCGIILTMTIVRPLWKIDLSVPQSIGTGLTDVAASAAEEGSAAARDAWEAYIIRETQTYIQNTAAQWNAEITAEIKLSREDPPVPEWIVLSGSISPYAKAQLENRLQKELGLTKENLEWTG